GVESCAIRIVCDAVGNCSSAGPVAGNKVDKKAPTISCAGPDGAWHANDVAVSCSASDGGSGLASASDASFSLSTSVAAGTETASASTTSRNVCDAVGNCASAGPVTGNKGDKKAPTVSWAGADGAWHSDDVTVGRTQGR